MKRLRLSFLLLGLPMMAAGLSAEPASPAETRLREALRSTTLQLRDAQVQVANLQSTQAETDQKTKDQAAQITALAKQAGLDHDAAQKTVAELKARAAQQTDEIERLKTTLAEWKAAQQKAAGQADTLETERAKLAAQVIELDRRVADQQAKNMAMFKLGNELLVRYEKFGLGDALTAREPFVGITRVKFQNLIQDYQDKIMDQKIKP